MRIFEVTVSFCSDWLKFPTPKVFVATYHEDLNELSKHLKSSIYAFAGKRVDKISYKICLLTNQINDASREKGTLEALLTEELSRFT